MNNIFYRMTDCLPFYRELKNAILKGHTPCSVTGVYNIHKAQLVMSLSRLGNVCLICDDEPAARRFVADINELSGEELACFFPAKDFSFAHTEGASREYEQERISALSKIRFKQCRILVSSIEAALQSCIPKWALEKYSFEIKNGDSISVEKLTQMLVASGYTRADQTEGPAQFSIRGGIIDIFSVNSSQPYRIELWGDEVDSISYFDTATQRRSDKADRVRISPACEIIFPSAESFTAGLEGIAKRAKGKRADKIREHIYSDIDLIKSGVMLSSTDKYYALAYPETQCVIDYFKSGIIAFSELSNCREKAKGFLGQLSEDLKLCYDEGLLCSETEGFYLEEADLAFRASNERLIYLDTFMRGYSDIKLKKLINASCFQTSSWGGDLKHLSMELKSLTNQDYCCVVLGGSDKTTNILVSDLCEEGLSAEMLKDDSELIGGRVYVKAGSVSGGFEYADAKLALLTQVKSVKTKQKVKKHKKGDEIKSLADINVGDYIVHSMYGIGKFTGISKLQSSGVTKDYITLKYHGTDVLYVPVTQLDLISRYIGASDEDNIKLNKLNTADWNKTKSRAKKAVEDMAQELIELYAKRQMSKGFAFSGDNDWQRNFEERFEWQETDDQLRSIEEIKYDMQKNVPMDRLLCGDVGFGKTEVALRAAFKCVLDSKQCAILVPTTVLAWQHYQSAIRRFEHFPITIELLSRFRTPKQQKEILKKLKSGEIDIVIGTHRLVQKDIEFKDLGLAIVDEEQRFGVRHKERFKEMFSGIDMLTLSATPIPRTLNMAMSGIRDMSVIEEPPQDRYPVQTYVIEHNDAVIAQAISKELRRGGQVYYIHNRIDNIYQCADRLQALLPEARIAVAHGQIDETELSEVWRKLIDNEIDVLVCTTIIETGVDVPNVNTLIIEDADRLGLSQLYQLRGRVGRSNRRAFAYFSFRRGKTLSEVATKRLNAIREFTQFGSGFRIALRDLEIRGAGSVLSGKQHGHMDAVGDEMYMRLLNEAVANAKGEAPPPTSEDCLVDVSINAYIPESYIRSETQRIDAYRRIASIVSEEDSLDVVDEFIDRYGDPPKSVMGLVRVALIRNMASKNGVSEINQRGDKVFFYIRSIEPQQITSLSQHYKNRIKFMDTSKPHFFIVLDKKQSSPELMDEAVKILNGAREAQDDSSSDGVPSDSNK